MFPAEPAPPLPDVPDSDATAQALISFIGQVLANSDEGRPRQNGGTSLFESGGDRVAGFFECAGAWPNASESKHLIF